MPYDSRGQHFWEPSFTGQNLAKFLYGDKWFEEGIDWIFSFSFLIHLHIGIYN